MVVRVGFPIIIPPRLFYVFQLFQIWIVDPIYILITKGKDNSVYSVFVGHKTFFRNVLDLIMDGFNHFLSRYFMFQVLVGIVGIIGNISLLFWFCSKRNTFHQLMSVLAVSDLIYIFSSIIIFGLKNIFKR